MNYLRYAMIVALLAAPGATRSFADTAAATAPAPAATPVVAQAAADSTPVAMIGTQTITEKQMDAELGAQLYDEQNKIYQIKKNWLMQKAKTSLFADAAKSAGMTLDAWRAKEITSQAPPPTQTDIDAATHQYFAKAPPTPEQITQLKQYLAQQKVMQREQTVYQQLSTKTPVQILVQKPAAPVINVTYAADDPYKGGKNAPVTIVEFTDFQCPYCKQSQAALQQVETTYGNQIKLVTRMYPLPFHNRAKPAAEAAMCAKEQGKYWEYRDKLFTDQKLEDADLHQYAVDVGLKVKKFDECVAANRYEPRIETDIADGQRFGVQGTPHFFINGQPISGAQPFSAFKDAIDDQLAKGKTPAAATTKS